MNDGDFEVDLIDKNGEIVGSKLRKNIIKGVDTYHAVYIVLITSKDELVINKIADRRDMPNLHAGKFGCTAATIRRTGETGEKAAQRAVANELKMQEKPELVHEELMNIDNTHRLIGWYKITGDKPEDYNREDIEELVVFSTEEFEKMLSKSPEKITPPLKKFWQLYSVTN